MVEATVVFLRAFQGDYHIMPDIISLGGRRYRNMNYDQNRRTVCEGLGYYKELTEVSTINMYAAYSKKVKDEITWETRHFVSANYI